MGRFWVRTGLAVVCEVLSLSSGNDANANRRRVIDSFSGTDRAAKTGDDVLASAASIRERMGSILMIVSL